MPPWVWFWLGVLSEIGTFILVGNDPDGWQLHDLLSWQPHHELWEVVLVIIGAGFFALYWKASTKATT